MTNNLEKIKQLIALGEKATEQGLRVDVPNDEEAICLSDHLRTRIIYLNDMTDCLGGYEGKQHLANFFVRAANTRADLADFVEEYEQLVATCERIDRLKDNYCAIARERSFQIDALKEAIKHAMSPLDKGGLAYFILEQALQETEQGE